MKDGWKENEIPGGKHKGPVKLPGEKLVKHRNRPAAHDVNGGDLAKGGSPYKEEKDYDKGWPPKPKPVKT